MNSNPCWFLLVFSSLITGSYANLRAPMMVPGGSSTALMAEKTPALTVLGEKLIIACDQLPVCSVTAEYTIYSSKDLPALLTFELGRASIDSNRVSVNDRKVETSSPPQAENTQNQGRLYLPMQQLRFTARFVQGQNKIVVNYRQKLPQIESGHSYFSDGKMVNLFRYQFAPLREWQVAGDFKLDFKLVLAGKKPGWFGRTFGSYTEMSCNYKIPGEKKNVEGRYRYAGSFKLSEIEDTITCRIGPDSLF